MPPRIEIIYANISKEENEKRLAQLEKTISTVLKRNVKLVAKGD